MKKKLISFILLSCSFMYGVACPTSGYISKVSLTVSAQGGTTTDMTRFPALYIGNAIFKTVGNGGNLQSSTGIDVIFCDAIGGGNLLPYELVPNTYTPTTGAGEWWIQLPTVSHSVSSVIYAFLNHTSPIDHSNAAGVWQNVTASNINASGVWHFGTSGTLTLTDSTGNNTATNHSATAVAAKINGGAAMTNGTAYIDSGGIINIAQQTITAWQNPLGNSVSVNGYNLFVSNQTTGSGTFTASGYGMYTFQGGITYFINNGSNQSCARFTNSGDLGGTLKYWAGSYNGGNATTLGSYALYENGVVQTASIVCSATTTMGTPTNDLLIGPSISGQANSNNQNIDEVHIWPGVLTADWILDEYNNTNAPATFFSTGSLAPAGGTSTQPWFGPLN